MHTRLTSILSAGLWATLALAGCAQDPTPAIPVPDYLIPGKPFDRGVGFDRGPRPDRGPGSEVGPTPDLGGDMGGDLDMQPVDMLPPTPGPADPTAVRVLSVRADTRVGWIAQAALWSARIDRFGQLAEVARVTDLPAALRGPVLGGRTATGPAWVVVADGPDGMWRAYDLSARPPVPVETNLWGEARVVTTGTAVLIFGRAAADAGAPLAWRALTADPDAPLPVPDMGAPDAGTDDAGTDDAAPPDAAAPAPGPPDPRRIDTLGLAVPEHAVTGLSNVVLGFADGLCAVLLPNLTVGGAWHCHARGDARLLSDKSQTFFVGNHRGDVVLWQAMPGASFAPGTDTAPPPADAGVEADAGLDAGLDAEVADLGLDLDADAPPPAPLGPTAVLAANAQIVHWLSPLDGAEVARVRGPEGDALWFFEPTRIRVVPLAETDADLQAVATNRRNLFALRWDEAGALSVTALQEQPGPLPPVFVPAATCGGQVEPEDCSDLDRDCDGDAKGGRCCVVTSQRRTEAILPAPRLASEAWVAGFDLERLLVALPREASTDLYRIPAAETLNSVSPFLRWPGAGLPALLSTSAGRVVALRLPATVASQPGPDPVPEPDAPVGELLWWVGAESLDPSTSPPTAPVSPAPCAPALALRLFTEGPDIFARVYCPAAAFDVRYTDRENPIERPYPEGAVRWLVDRAFEGRDLLVATGDDHVLARLEESLDGFAPSAVPLGDTLGALINTERTLPLRPPVAADGWYARINEKRVEVWAGERGWQAMPSSRWPLSAQISPHDPLAISVVQVVDPATVANPLTVPLDVRLHHLGPEAAPWGRPPRAGVQQPTEAGSATGLRLGDFPVTAFNRPILLRIAGPAASGLVGEAVQCD